MQQTGVAAEGKALAYLKEQGLLLIARNYRCRWGEIDLIMQDKEYWVMVEVRARTGFGFGGGLASITAAKKNKIIKTASHFLAAEAKRNQKAVRFDVISIDGPAGALLWVRDAFRVGD
ncbi:MAG: YraN family protein [Legionella sp.]|nr:MAG: YraN family protein [Legionella sp.]PJD97124.1 MAG: YraN family protein [Legionella sp.]